MSLAPRRDGAAPGTSARRDPLRSIVLPALFRSSSSSRVWWLVQDALDVWSDLILPSPAQVWHTFVYSMTSHDGRPGYFGTTSGSTLWASVWRILNGVVRAVVIGVPLGIAIATWRSVAALVEPWVNFLRSLPPLAYFVLLIFWFGIGDSSKIWLLFGAAFPPITLATIAGVKRVAPTASTPPARLAPPAARCCASRCCPRSCRMCSPACASPSASPGRPSSPPRPSTACRASAAWRGPPAARTEPTSP